MTDSEKLDLILSEMQGMKGEIKILNEKVSGLEKDMIDVKADLKQTERVLKNEIRKGCGLVLDEVERVHDILDKQKENKTAHTA